MSATRDNSVLFSLNQLLNLHEETVRAEEEAARARIEAERVARQEAARREAEAALAKARAEAERIAREEAARREETARLEALRLAEVERARAEVEAQARLEMMRKADEHERALAALREDDKKKRLKRALISCVVGAAALIGGVAGLYFGKLKPEQDARLANQAAEVEATREEAAKLRAKVDADGKRMDETTRKLEEEKRRARELEEAKAAANEAAQARQGRQGPAPKQAEAPKTGGKCLPGEPGCDLDGNRLF
jgi:colicin import membrane protein